VVEKIDGAFTGFAVGAYEVEVVSIVELIVGFLVGAPFIVGLLVGDFVVVVVEAVGAVGALVVGLFVGVAVVGVVGVVGFVGAAVVGA